jgi:hypothetical protein
MDQSRKSSWRGLESQILKGAWIIAHLALGGGNNFIVFPLAQIQLVTGRFRLIMGLLC